jgi:flagellar hook assembly protein FlgD
MTVDICPNPSSGAVAFRLSTPRSAHVRVCVYDVRGRLVSRPLEGQLAPGTHSLAWDADDASGHPVDSGIYFCRVELGGKVHASKIVILRQ